MALTRRKRLQRWSLALGASAAVHLAILFGLMQRQPPHHYVEMPVVQVDVRRFIEPNKPEPKPEPVKRPPPPAPEITSRPVETPPVAAATTSVPAARTPAPAAPAAPAPPAQTAQQTGPLNLGCEGRAYDRLSQQQKAACMRLVINLGKIKPGEPPLEPNAKDKAMAAESAANAARDAQHATGDNKTFGCPEAKMGVGCTEDRLGITLYKQKF